MLLQNLYSIESSSEVILGKQSVEILINPCHKLFEGHFPGSPILPGVCMLQIIKELVEGALNAKVSLQTLTMAKFIALTDPNKTPRLKFELDIKNDGNQLVNIKSTTYIGEIIALKASIVYTKNI